MFFGDGETGSKQLDQQVAEHVLRWCWWRSSVSGRRSLFPENRVPEWFTQPADGTEPVTFDHLEFLPPFSTDDALALHVLKEYAGRRPHDVVTVTRDGWKYCEPVWRCAVQGVTFKQGFREEAGVSAEGATMAIAVCRSLLAAVGRLGWPD